MVFGLVQHQLKKIKIGIKIYQMAKIKRFTEKDGGYHGELGFKCPGCKEVHLITDNLTDTEAIANGPWIFNGDFENPTIQPSVLTRNYLKNPKTGKHDIEINRCHSFITVGFIQFLSDCMHELRGQTIELPEITDDAH